MPFCCHSLQDVMEMLPVTDSGWQLAQFRTFACASSSAQRCETLGRVSSLLAVVACLVLVSRGLQCKCDNHHSCIENCFLCAIPGLGGGGGSSVNIKCLYIYIYIVRNVYHWPWFLQNISCFWPLFYYFLICLCPSLESQSIGFSNMQIIKYLKKLLCC